MMLRRFITNSIIRGRVFGRKKNWILNPAQFSSCLPMKFAAVSATLTSVGEITAPGSFERSMTAPMASPAARIGIMSWAVYAPLFIVLSDSDHCVAVGSAAVKLLAHLHNGLNVIVYRFVNGKRRADCNITPVRT